ncbi:tRNA (adenosine(37)-N6)-methyltransferase TrmM, partial [Proteus mirabilis]
INPPYFEPAVAFRNQEREQSRYTKTLTHVGLLDNAKQLITDEGLFCVVLPYLICEKFIEISQRKGRNVVQRVNIKD